MNKLFFTLLFLALAAYGQMQERVAIINTLDDYDSISVANLTYLTDKLREAAVNVLPNERFGVMTTESIVAFLGSMENTIRVCKESSCLADLGRQVSADYVAQGRLGRFSKNLTIKVELYNVKTGNLMGSFAGESKDIDGLRDIIGEKSVDLFKRMLAEPKTTAASQPVPVAETVSLDSIQTLIKKNLYKNKVKIQKASFPLSPSDKIALYEKNQKEAALSAVLNVLPGFGVGSYMQGDIFGGVVLSVYGVAGWSLLLVYGYDGNYNKDNDNAKLAMRNGIIIGLISGHYLVGLMQPFFYKYGYNKTLREALNIDEDISLSIAPLIVPRDGTPAVGLAFNVRY